MFPFVTEAMAQTAPGASIAQNPIFQFMPFILIFVVFYFLIIRPQQKKQKALQNLLSGLQKGDQVITTGGIHGTINKVGEDWLTLEIGAESAKSILIKLDRNQVARLATEGQKEQKEQKKE